MAAQKDTKGRTWGYGELTVADIVECALRLIEREGVAKLTMRRMAEELGMSSMITYYYVSSKQEVLDLVIDRIYGAIEIPPPESGDWASRIRGMCLNARRELIKYPGLAAVIQTRPLAANARRLANMTNEVLLDRGIVDADLHDASLALHHYQVGGLAWEMQARSVGPVDDAHMEQRYAAGLEVILRGLRVMVDECMATGSTDEPCAVQPRSTTKATRR